MTTPQKYRWLTQGVEYIYGPKAGKGDDTRRGTLCRVLILPRAGTKPANVKVGWPDGHVAIVPSGALRIVTT